VAHPSAHGLLVQSNWEGADLAALTRVQLKPYVPDGGKRLQIEGPAVSLPADLATPFGLVLHELATNAAKHGSLAGSAGTVSVTWQLSRNNGAQDLRLQWRESGGETPSKSAPAGLGSDLIENAIPGAVVRRELRPQGVTCTIELRLPEAKNGQNG
jgi:two-component system CheB/CheR fusion protein